MRLSRLEGRCRRMPRATGRSGSTSGGGKDPAPSGGFFCAFSFFAHGEMGSQSRRRPLRERKKSDLLTSWSLPDKHLGRPPGKQRGRTRRNHDPPPGVPSTTAAAQRPGPVECTGCARDFATRRGSAAAAAADVEPSIAGPLPARPTGEPAGAASRFYRLRSRRPRLSPRRHRRVAKKTVKTFPLQSGFDGHSRDTRDMNPWSI